MMVIPFTAPSLGSSAASSYSLGQTAAAVYRASAVFRERGDSPTNEERPCEMRGEFPRRRGLFNPQVGRSAWEQVGAKHMCPEPNERCFAPTE